MEYSNNTNSKIWKADRLFTVIAYPGSKAANIFVWDRDHWLSFDDSIDGMRLIGTYPTEYSARLAICRQLPKRRSVSVSLCPETPADCFELE